MNDDLPPLAGELNHELVELVNQYVRDLGVVCVVGNLMALAYVIACQGLKGDEAEAIRVLERHIDYFAKRPIRADQH